jgi:protein-S-isoprenylcysteine O-methyltransferase Ste14
MNSISVPIPMSDVSGMSPVGLCRLRSVAGRSIEFVLVAGGLVLSWGWDQVLVLFAHPARAAVLAVIALQFALSVAQVIASQPVATRPIRRLREPWFFLLLAGALLLVLSSPFFDGRVLLYLPGADLTRYSGLAMFLTGAILATWAQRHLGRFLSGELALQEGHRLITDGPFARIRHPRYAGLMLMLIGLPMVFLSKVGLVGGVAGFVLFLLRTFREEKLLASEFGDEWSRYSGSTKRLVPWVY